MVRTPCYEKTGMKKGPWSTEEDRILIKYINENGHGNWRALPKRAGLLRCGKSCRLRWLNYLRPDIKRGNFTLEEEETITKLHAELGNKWSVIAARLPGRTDNEIKNIWHTQLKKRQNGNNLQPKTETRIKKLESYSDFDRKVGKYPEPSSPVQSFSETLSATTAGSSGFDVHMMTESLYSLKEIEESFWSEVFSGGDWGGGSDFPSGNSESQLQSANLFASDLDAEIGNGFWQNVFYRAEEFTELF